MRQQWLGRQHRGGRGPACADGRADAIVPGALRGEAAVALTVTS
ncbi:hypothetical protein [Microbacterium sp. zg.Y909]|nr:hypothetical protein [Microbacterium sp. zg.Y909]MCR2826658.1 hypothetical protein [Microbacterium sp. zg.Y909]